MCQRTVDARAKYTRELIHLFDEMEHEIRRLRRIVEALPSAEVISHDRVVEVAAAFGSPPRTKPPRGAVFRLAEQAKAAAVGLSRAHGATWRTLATVMGGEKQRLSARYSTTRSLADSSTSRSVGDIAAVSAEVKFFTAADQ